MIVDNIKANENIKPNTNEMEKLKINFPQFFDKNGEFMLDRFKDMLKQNEVGLVKEGYELRFLGKSYARYISSTKTETFIAPDEEENQKEENKDSENLYIVGDNLDALKHLLGSYAGKIKCIYIDPPYNTGSDGFVYPDNFYFDEKKLSEMLGIEEEEASRIINLKGKSSHSAWLTFIYPRLILARELLSEDGVIFISIDDNEQANLKMVCDEIFGEENFLVDIKWANKEGGGSSDSKLFKIKDEHILLYAKNKAFVEIKGLSPTNVDRYNESDEYENTRGKYYLQKLGMGSIKYSESMDYPITMEDGSIIYPSDNNGGKKAIWRWSRDKYNWGLKNGYIVQKKDKNNKWIIYTKQYLNADNEGNIISRTQVPSGLILEYSSTQASKELVKLNLDEFFSYPKPTKLITFLIDRICKTGIILDFFSGSATTAHAVMQLNAYDGGNRKYILVQIPEKIDEKKPAYVAGYRTIDEIGRERIRRAAAKIREETNANIDYGFKTYFLEEIKEDVLTRLNYFADTPSLILDDMVGVFDTKHAKGKEAILSTYLVMDGYGLGIKCEDYKLEKFVASKIEKSLYIIEKGLESSDVMEIIKRIENLELDITRIVVYATSISFNIMHELKKNLFNLKNNKTVELVERY